MRKPELELSFLCEGAGIDPVAILSALDPDSDMVSAERLACAVRGADVERMISVLSIAGTRGAAVESRQDGAPSDKREWKIDKGAFVALIHEAKVIYDSMPEIRRMLSPGSRYRIAATIPRRLPELESFYRVFENTVLGMRRLIGEAKSEILVMVPFIDRTGFDAILPTLDDAIGRGVKVVFLSRKVDKGEESRIALSGLLSGNKRAAEFLSLFEASLDGDIPLSHAKVISRDGGAEVYIGSANLTGASMEWIVEIGVFIKGNDGIPIHDLLRGIRKRSIKRWP
jgi:phosphatidylserine/phosphatidylglycerophosphate/cardiolipin synthase-like enzyme